MSLKKNCQLMVATLGVILISNSVIADSVIKSVTSKATGSALNALKGVGEGIDEHFRAEFEIDPNTKLDELGLEINNIKNKELGTNTIAAYIIANKAFKGKIQIKALNDSNKEVGRATQELELEEDDANDFLFVFGEHMDSALVTKYVISVKPSK